MTVSLWHRSRSPETHCDCVVIGAGICGLSAALHLERRGVATVVVDRSRIGAPGAGASSRNAGFLMRGAAENYAAAIRTYGRELARLVWRWTEENLAGLRAEGIEGLPGYAARPSCLLALEEQECKELRESVSLLREDGFAVEWLDGGEDDAWRNLHPLGGLLNPGDAACHPAHILHHLASKLRRPVREECPVIGLSGDGNGRIRVQTVTGDLLGARVLLCTNAYAPLLVPSLAGIITPRRGQVIAVRCDTRSRLDHSYYANYGYEYFRQVEPQVLLFGGCRRAFADAEIGYEDRTTPEVQGALESFAARTLAIPRSRLEVIARWSGTMGFSPDGLPLIVPVEGDWERGRVHFCGGFTGHGMSLAYRVAQDAIRALLEEAVPVLHVGRTGLNLRTIRATGHAGS